MAGLKLRARFAVENKFTAFYTGGKVEFSRDGHHMFCQCGNKVSVVDVTSGITSDEFEKEGDEDVSCFILSPDNESLVVASKNLMIRQWNWKEKKIVKSWKSINVGPISCMTFDCTSTLLACGSSDSTIKVYDIVKQYYTHNLRQHQGVVTAVEFHPDIQTLQLFTAAEDYKIRVWSLQTSACIATLESHFSTITSLVFSSTGHTLYSAGRDKVVVVWDAEDFAKKKTIPVYEVVESLVVVEKKQKKLNIIDNDDHFITAGSKGVLQVWQASTGRCVFTHSESVVNNDEKEEDGQLILMAMPIPALSAVSVVTFDHNIIIYNEDDLSLQKQFVGNNDDVLDVKFIGKNDSHIAVATNSELVKVYEVVTWTCQVLRGHTSIVMAMDVYKNGLLLTTSSKDNKVLVWLMSEESGRLFCVARGLGHIHSVGAIVFSRMNPTFLVSGSIDLTIKVWNLPKDLMSSHHQTTEEIPALSVHATEKAHDKDINSLAISPNDKLIASASQDRTAKLWRAPGLDLLGVFQGHKRGIWSINFSPVDQCVVTASGDSTIKIWALSDFSCVKTFEGHESSALNVLFLSRGMQLISSGSDGLIKLWTIKTSECVKTMDEHDARVWALAINKAEDRIVTGAGDSSILMWKDVTEEELTEKREEKEKTILLEQELSNLLNRKKYLKAIGLAITLHQPFRVLNIIKEILGNPGGKDELAGTICKLRADQLDSVLGFAVEWNTNSRHCHAAQQVVSILLQHFTPEKLKELPNIKSSLEGLLPYTDRHYQRMGRLLQQSTLVDYTWECMKLVGKERVTIVEKPKPHSGPSYKEDRLGSTVAYGSSLDTNVSSSQSSGFTDTTISSDPNISGVTRMETASESRESSNDDDVDSEIFKFQSSGENKCDKDGNTTIVNEGSSLSSEDSDLEEASSDDMRSETHSLGSPVLTLQMSCDSDESNLDEESGTVERKKIKVSDGSDDVSLCISDYSDDQPTKKSSSVSPACTKKESVLKDYNTEEETPSDKENDSVINKQIAVEDTCKNAYTALKMNLRNRTPVKKVANSPKALESPRRSTRLVTQECKLQTPQNKKLRQLKTPTTEPTRRTRKSLLDSPSTSMTRNTRRRKLST